MSHASLRSAAWTCLAIWAAIWVFFLGLRFSSLDVRDVPGVRKILLPAFAVSLFAPILATGLTVLALIRQPRLSLNWFLLGCAVIVVIADVLFALIATWM